jgi:hypothetical protein
LRTSLSLRRDSYYIPNVGWGDYYVRIYGKRWICLVFWCRWR